MRSLRHWHSDNVGIVIQYSPPEPPSYGGHGAWPTSRLWRGTNNHMHLSVKSYFESDLIIIRLHDTSNNQLSIVDLDRPAAVDIWRLKDEKCVRNPPLLAFEIQLTRLENNWGKYYQLCCNSWCRLRVVATWKQPAGQRIGGVQWIGEGGTMDWGGGLSWIRRVIGLEIKFEFVFKYVKRRERWAALVVD